MCASLIFSKDYLFTILVTLCEWLTQSRKFMFTHTHTHTWHHRHIECIYIAKLHARGTHHHHGNIHDFRWGLSCCNVNTNSEYLQSMAIYSKHSKDAVVPCWCGLLGGGQVFRNVKNQYNLLQCEQCEHTLLMLTMPSLSDPKAGRRASYLYLLIYSHDSHVRVQQYITQKPKQSVNPFP